MNPDLETILAADEEAAARVEAARTDLRREADAERAASEERRAERARALAEALENQIRDIETAAERESAEIAQRHAQYVDDRGRAAEGREEQAIAVFVAIVRDGPGREASS